MALVRTNSSGDHGNHPGALGTIDHWMGLALGELLVLLPRTKLRKCGAFDGAIYGLAT